MIYGIGTDIVEIIRVKEMIERNSKFIDKVFSKNEIEFLKKKNLRPEHVAGRIAAKEAISKAMGTGFRGFEFKDIEIINDLLGKPMVILNGKAKSIVEELGEYKIHVSISHGIDNAVAYSILEIEKADIVNSSVDEFDNNEYTMNLETVSRKIISRKNCMHKGDFGRVAIVAGSKDFVGAAYISATAAVKSGAGLVTLCCRDNIQEILSSKLVEAMTVSFQSERFQKVIESSDAIAFGPGMGNNEETLRMLKFILEKANSSVLIDADGLNVLENNTHIIKNYKNGLVLTPHLGEMSKLTGLSIEYIKENRSSVARDFAKEFNVILLLKGYNTVITDGQKIIINPTGNSAMATGGMGDCLTGIIAALIGQGYDAFTATYLGAYVHGYCGDILSKDMFSVNAESVINIIPKVIKEIDNYKSK